LGERVDRRVCGGERHSHSHGVHEVGQPKRGGALLASLEGQVHFFNVWLHQPVHSVPFSGQSSLFSPENWNSDDQMKKVSS
jgi:hypothetical protein